MKASVSLPKLFLFAAALMGIFSLIVRTYYGDSAIDIHQHDTYYVIAHFHIVIAVAVFFLIIAGIYYITPKLSGRRLHYGLGIIHFICTVLPIIAILWPMHFDGIAGMPRRYYDYSAWDSFLQFVSLDTMISIAAMLLFSAQILFLVNLVFGIIAGKRLSTAV